MKLNTKLHSGEGGGIERNAPPPPYTLNYFSIRHLLHKIPLSQSRISSWNLISEESNLKIDCKLLCVWKWK